MKSRRELELEEREAVEYGKEVLHMEAKENSESAIEGGEGKK